MMATQTMAIVEYPSSDGKPMAESDVHIDILADIRARLKAWAASRENVYAAGNMLVYYEEGNPKARLAPDCFVVFGVRNYDRSSFLTWSEGRTPRVVFEFTSRGTRKEDTVKKFAIYQNVWRVAEYFLFDPMEAYLKPSLRGYRLTDGVFQPIPETDGTLHSEELDANLSRDGIRLRLEDVRTGKEFPLPMERRAIKAEKIAARNQAALEQAEAENARLKAELAALKKKRSS